MKGFLKKTLAEFSFTNGGVVERWLPCRVIGEDPEANPGSRFTSLWSEGSKYVFRGSLIGQALLSKRFSFQLAINPVRHVNYELAFAVPYRVLPYFGE